jgi:ArsR family metal-binding transcriptional regulator
MSFAADLRNGKVELTKCPLLEKQDYAENRIRLEKLFTAPER